MTKLADLHKEFMQDPEYAREYAKADTEYSMLESLIEARAKAKMSQEDVARELNTSQPAIARLESGRNCPSLRTLRNYAHAVGAELEIRLVRRKTKTAA